MSHNIKINKKLEATLPTDKIFKINDDYQTDNVLTCIFYNHLDIRKFRELCGNLVYSNEYQCHYFALVRTESINDIQINFVFPLIYYNYKQEVSSATVDFDMEDVTNTAKQLSELVSKKASIMKTHISNIKPIFENSKISYKITFYNNIHKHP